MGVNIHPQAIVDPKAELGTDVVVGPFAMVGPLAKIGDRRNYASCHGGGKGIDGHTKPCFSLRLDWWINPRP